MKKFLLLMFFVFPFFLAFAGNKGDAYLSGLLPWEHCNYQIISEEDKTVMIVGYWTGYNPEGSVKLPDTIVCNGEEYKIIEIGDYAFVNCLRLINVELPAYLQTIGEYAFKGCENLLSVKFPSCLEEIEECAFFDCKSLMIIMLPDNLKKIGAQAFFRM